MDSIILQQLIERLSSLLRNESRQILSEHGLQPVQFEALHYLSMCNHYSDTPMAVTEFLGHTKGTVSQTLKVLEKKGLIEKRADEKDKRVIHLFVTPAGKTILETVLPSTILQRLCNQMEEKEQAIMIAQLTSLLQKLQEVNQFKTFGQCFSCIHNIPKTEGKYLCGLTKEPLLGTDIQLICREHKPSSAVQPPF